MIIYWVWETNIRFLSSCFSQMKFNCLYRYYSVANEGSDKSLILLSVLYSFFYCIFWSMSLKMRRGVDLQTQIMGISIPYPLITPIFFLHSFYVWILQSHTSLRTNITRFFLFAFLRSFAKSNLKYASIVNLKDMFIMYVCVVVCVRVSASFCDFFFYVNVDPWRWN